MHCQLARVGQVYTRLLDLAFPPTCVLCADPGGRVPDLCDPCAAELPWIATACPLCARPGPVAAVCGRCLAEPPAFDAAFAPLAYASPVSHLVRRLKYHGQLPLARPLAALLAEALGARRGAAVPSLLVPVPLHRHRLRERGFNQSAELGRLLARRLDLRLDHRLVTRTRDTPPQAALAHPRRRANVHGAFSATRSLHGASIAVVDDVITSGNTVGELAACLKSAGAQRVEIWALARA